MYHLNEIFSTVRNEYTDWDKPIVHPINVRDSVLEALSDGHTVSQLLRVAALHTKRGQSSTHIFHFNYQPRDSDFHEVSSIYIYLGVHKLFIFNFKSRDLDYH